MFYFLSKRWLFGKSTSILYGVAFFLCTNLGVTVALNFSLNKKTQTFDIKNQTNKISTNKLKAKKYPCGCISVRVLIQSAILLYFLSFVFYFPPFFFISYFNLFIFRLSSCFPLKTMIHFFTNHRVYNDNLHQV